MDRLVPKAKAKKNIKSIQNDSHFPILHFADHINKNSKLNIST